MSTASYIERRKTPERIPVLIEVVVTSLSNNTDSIIAELRDVNCDGAGLIMWSNADWLKGKVVNVKIAFSSQFSSKEPIFGTFREQSPPCKYWPNFRSGGFCVDSGRDCLQEIIEDCCVGDSAPAKARFGFQRAWSILCKEDRSLLKPIWLELQAGGGDEAQIADNLLTDPNCGGHRLSNLMAMMVKVRHNNSEMRAMEVLEKAFEVYRIEDSLVDTQKDRLIEYELGPVSLTSV